LTNTNYINRGIPCRCYINRGIPCRCYINRGIPCRCYINRGIPCRCYINRGNPLQVLHQQGNPLQVLHQQGESPAGATSTGGIPCRGIAHWALSFNKPNHWKGTNDRQQKSPHLKGMGL